jgi:hypothetical protein
VPWEPDKAEHRAFLKRSLLTSGNPQVNTALFRLDLDQQHCPLWWCQGWISPFSWSHHWGILSGIIFLTPQLYWKSVRGTVVDLQKNRLGICPQGSTSTNKESLHWIPGRGPRGLWSQHGDQDFLPWVPIITKSSSFLFFLLFWEFSQ